MKAPLNTILLGGCLLNRPLTLTDCAKGKLALKRYGTLREVHTFGEMFQVIDILKGNKKVPRELAPLWHIPAGLKPVEDAKDFSELDVALIEPSSPPDLIFRGTVINRNKIKGRLLLPVVKGNKEAGQLAAKWLRKGLIEQDEKVREQTSARLLEIIKADDEETAFIREVIAETRAVKGDFVEAMTRLKTLLGCPIGVIAYAFRYMPDGRIISWPATFRDEVIDAATKVGFPIFNPSPLVVKFGVTDALSEDSRHYSDPFMPIIGEALVEFAQSVYAQAKTTAKAPALHAAD